MTIIHPYLAHDRPPFMNARDQHHYAATSLAQLLDGFVHEAEQAFPALRGKLVIYNVRRNTYYVSDAFNRAARGFRSQSKFEHFISNHEVAEDARVLKNKIAAFAVRVDKKQLSLIMFNESVQNKEINKLSARRVQELLLTLDHELAHLAAKDAYNLENDRHGNLVEETVAECFAQLMHYKRFGMQGHFADGDGALDLARTFAFHDSEMKTHFYYPAVRQIAANRHAIDFAALTPADLADLARRFAIRFAPSNAQVADMDEAFADCRKAYRRGGIEPAMRALAEVAETTQHPHVARISVDLYLDLAAQRKTTLQGADWNAITQRMKLLDFKLSKEDILYRVPRRSQAADYRPPRP